MDFLKNIRVLLHLLIMIFVVSGIIAGFIKNNGLENSMAACAILSLLARGFIYIISDED